MPKPMESDVSIASPIAPRESPDHAPDAPDAPQSWSGAERRDRIPPAARRLLRWYYALKYRLFRREAHVPDGIRGLIVLQIRSEERRVGNGCRSHWWQ